MNKLLKIGLATKLTGLAASALIVAGVYDLNSDHRSSEEIVARGKLDSGIIYIITDYKPGEEPLEERKFLRTGPHRDVHLGGIGKVITYAGAENDFLQTFSIVDTKGRYVLRADDYERNMPNNPSYWTNNAISDSKLRANMIANVNTVFQKEGWTNSVREGSPTIEEAMARESRGNN